MIPDFIKQSLINKAIKQYGTIKKIARHNKEFTIEGDEIWFWFNDSEDSTKVVSIKLENPSHLI